MLIESDEDDLECEYSLFLGMINLDVNILENWTTTSQVGDTEVQFLMDTGAKCNVLTRDTYHKLNITAQLEKPEASLTSYSWHSIATDGMVTIPLQNNGHVNPVKFYVIPIIFWEPIHVVNLTWWDVWTLLTKLNKLRITVIHLQMTFLRNYNMQNCSKAWDVYLESILFAER